MQHLLPRSISIAFKGLQRATTRTLPAPFAALGFAGAGDFASSIYYNKLK